MDGSRVSSRAPASAQRADLRRRHAETERLRMVYATLGSVHTAAMPALSVSDLFARACAALVKDGVYRVAWWGLPQGDGSIEIGAHAGDSSPPLPPSLPAVEDAPWQHALARNEPIVLRRDARRSARRPFGLLLGASRVLLLPITLDGRPSALLTVGTGARHALGPDEVALLTELGRLLTTHAERVRVEGDLAAQREMLRAVFDCATYGIFYAHADGRVVLCNDAYARLLGVPRDQAVGTSCFTAVAPEVCEQEQAILERVMSTGLPSEYDKDFVRVDGFRLPVRMSVAPLRDRTGKAVGIVAVVRDTVAEREAAKALRESEARYRSAFRNNPDAIFVVGRDRRIVDANPAATALTGLARSELVSRPFQALAAPGEAEIHAVAHDDLTSHGAVFRPLIRLRTAKGKTIDAELHGTTLGSELWQVLVRDIGERIAAETRLLALKDELEDLVAARTRELRDANTALANAGVMKDQFIANMSHELRTPLHSVLGLADALVAGVYGSLDEAQTQVLVTLRESGGHLLALINDILDLSKIDAGHLELDLRLISVAEVCQASLRMVRQIAIGKKVGTWMRVDPKFPVVVADERRLKQMLVNLLSNAVKFTPEGGRAGIEAWANETDAFFCVTDTGIGISPSDLRRVFEPFTQIDSSLSRQHEGTGLGLALVRRLAELHGGRIELDSEVGSGSRFTIILPRLRAVESEPLSQR